MADEIAYRHHDVDDGVESELLDPRFLSEHVPPWGEEESARCAAIELRWRLDTLEGR